MPEYKGVDEGSGYGVSGESSDRTGVLGKGGEYGVVGGTDGIAGVLGVGESRASTGVRAENKKGGTAISAFSMGVNTTIYALAAGGLVEGDDTTREAIAIHGVAPKGGWGVVGSGGGSKGWPSGGVKGTGQNLPGVHGISAEDVGVIGESKNRNTGVGVNGKGIIGVHGESSLYSGVREPSIGVFGEASAGVGVFGKGGIGLKGEGQLVGAEIDGGNIGLVATSSKIAVKAKSDSIGTLTTGSIGLIASGNPYAAILLGSTLAAGTFFVSGAKYFKIDHPIEPDKKYLNHSSVESSEMKNIYDGTVKLGRTGTATVKLPKWFEALNKDFRYQLTPIGAAAPDLHISAPVKDGSFQIAGGRSGLEVCWQITGVRNDAFAKQNPIKVEEAKAKKDQGKYLNPECFQKKNSAGIFDELLSDDAKTKKPSKKPEKKANSK